jgi:ABC-type polysaccharide/polyol phosphate export permease
MVLLTFPLEGKEPRRTGFDGELHTRQLPGLTALVQYRPLIRFLVSSSLRKESARTAFGYVWWLLDPLLLMAAYVILVDVILRRGGENFPVFVLTALISWKFFQSGMRNAMAVTISKETLMRQVAFPKAVLPLAAVLAEAVHFAFGLITLLAVAVAFGIYPQPVIGFVLLVGLVQLAFTQGAAFVLSAANIFFRDVHFLATHGFRVWFYLSPALYPVSDVPEAFRSVYMLNPFATFFPAYQDAVLYHRVPDLTNLGLLALVSSVVLVAGYALFVHLEPSFTKIS